MPGQGRHAPAYPGRPSALAGPAATSTWLRPAALASVDAFHAYPADARRHFIRRTKEEMVRFDGSCIYPWRLSDTL